MFLLVQKKEVPHIYERKREVETVLNEKPTEILDTLKAKILK
jgi:hypothetical protein